MKKKSFEFVWDYPTKENCLSLCKNLNTQHITYRKFSLLISTGINNQSTMNNDWRTMVIIGVNSYAKYHSGSCEIQFLFSQQREDWGKIHTHLIPMTIPVTFITTIAI